MKFKLIDNLLKQIDKAKIFRTLMLGIDKIVLTSEDEKGKATMIIEYKKKED